MKGKAFTILHTSCLSELSWITAAKILKKPVSLTDWGSNFQEGEGNQCTKRKTESYIFSGLDVSISLGWGWKSTTERFATGQFWLFTWKTSSVGEDKCSKWEFYNMKFMTIVFVIVIQLIFQCTLQLLFRDCWFIYFHSLMKSAFLLSKGLLWIYESDPSSNVHNYKTFIYS